MKVITIAAMITLGCKLIGQNIIPNPGFDAFTQCPYAYSQINFASPWVSANNGTPDFYNECSSINGINVPHAGHYIDSYQKQRSGTGYAGIFVFTNANFIAYEYIECPLLNAMRPGKPYYIEFYVSPDLTSSTNWHYTDAVGLAFSDAFYYIDVSPIPLSPAIENRGILITDTIGWTRVSGCYIAHGGEKFAIIGNFRNASDTQLIVEDPNVYPYLNYFYIEDVLVSIFDPLPDTVLLCNKEELTLNANFLDAKYKWNTGATDSMIIVHSPGEYTLDVILPNCILRDTVIVLNNEINSFPDDTIFCADEVLTLTAPTAGKYTWSTGSTEKSIRVSQSGNYSLTVSNACGDYSYEVNVEDEICDCMLYIPNIITSNNDGINDYLTVNFNCDYPYAVQSFVIYDRWGNNIYAVFNDSQIEWNGQFSNGNQIQSGIYVWQLNYTINRNGIIVHKMKSGDVTIIN